MRECAYPVIGWGKHFFLAALAGRKIKSVYNEKKAARLFPFVMGGFSRTLCQTKNVQGQGRWREGRRAAVQQPRRPLSGFGRSLFKTGKEAFCMKNVKGRSP